MSSSNINSKKDEIFFKLLSSKFEKIKKQNVIYELYSEGKIKHFSTNKFIYYFKEKKIWFIRTFAKSRYVYIFGLNYGNDEDLILKKPILILDFSKNEFFNECAGLILDENDKIKVLLNENYLNLRSINKKIIFHSVNSNKIKVLGSNFFVIGENQKEILNNLFNLLKELEPYIINEKLDFKENLKIKKINNYSSVFEEEEEDKFCSICKEKLDKSYNKKVCKKCLRKKYAAKIAKNLLNHVDYNIPFNKDDLKKLDLNEIQVKDYIWTLQEFNLLENENANLIFKNKTFIEEFINKYFKENNELGKNEYKNNNLKESDNVKFSKECEFCKKVLPISNFHKSLNTTDKYERFCKACKKSIHTSKYLKNIIKYVEPNQNFLKDDLTQYYDNDFVLTAQLWTLQDADLINFNSKTGTYLLKDKKTIDNYIDKFYSYNEDAPKIKEDNDKNVIIGKENLKKEVSDKANFVENNLNKEKEENNKKQQESQSPRTIFINAFKEGKSFKESSKIAETPEFIIKSWYNEGKKGNSKFLNFYNGIEKIKKLNANNDVFESKNEAETSIGDKNIIETDSKLFDEKVSAKDIFIKAFKEGKSFKESSKIAKTPEFIIKSWYNKGKNGNSKFLDFYNKIKEIESIKNLNYTKEKHNSIIKAISEGKSTVNANIESNLDADIFELWCEKGKMGISPFKEFYEDYTNAIKKSKSILTNDIDKIKNNVLSLIYSNKTIEEAASLAKTNSISEETILNWYEYGKTGFKDYVNFYNECNEALNDMKKFNYSKDKQKMFINAIKEGKTKEEASKTSGLKLYDFNLWYRRGKKGILPFKQFYLDYENSIKNLKLKEEDKTDEVNLYQFDKEPNYIYNQDNKLIYSYRNLNNYFKELNNDLSYFVSNLDKNEAKIIINGLISSNNLINILKDLKPLNNEIIKIISNRINENKVDILIELKFESDKVNRVLDLIKNINWK